MKPMRNPACDLPDLPRWVDARATVLSGACDILGMPGEQSCIIRSLRWPMATVVGKPSTELLLRAIDIVGDQIELVVMPDDASHVQRVLRYWREEPATVHTRPTELDEPKASVNGVRIYDPWSSRSKPGFTDAIKQALHAAEVVAARRVNGKVTAVCHTDAITEQWWDVGVETVESHRRQGHSRACFAAMNSHMLERGKRPVWIALDRNVPSMRMAASLGFQPVDELRVFLSPNRKAAE